MHCVCTVIAEKHLRKWNKANARVEQSQNSVTVLSSQEDFEWAIRTVLKDKDEDTKSEALRSDCS